MISSPNCTPSFRELMEKDEISSTDKEFHTKVMKSPPSNSKSFSWGIPTVTRKNNLAIKTPSATEGNCWGSGQNNCSDLSLIIEDETTRKVSDQKIMNKSLSVVQTEETAIQELYSLYSSKYDDGEAVIIVERVTKPVNSPIWSFASS